MRFRIVRSAHRHKITATRIYAVLTNAGAPVVVPSSERGRRDVWWWVGADDRGVEWEIGGVVAAEDPELIIIVHAMPTAFRRDG